MGKDIVIPLGKGSRWNDNELRYCLRSIERFMPRSRVFIVGHRPKWVKNVIHIPFTDNPDYEAKERNIKNKFLAACDHPELSEDFWAFNDDYFILQKPPARYPYFYDKCLSSKIATRPFKDHYQYAQINTYETLKNLGYTTLNYDVHFPILYNKTKFREVMDLYDWNIQHGYVVKSLYCNTLEIKGTQTQDCKLTRRRLLADLQKWTKGKLMFSIGDGAINGQLERFLRITFPYPSKYE